MLGNDRGAMAVRRCIGQDDDELVAAEPADQVFAPRAFKQARADLLQQAIAGFVTVQIVDRLEAVQVDEQQCAPTMAALRRRDQMEAVLEDQRPVRQSGQCVVQRRLADALLGQLALGDVA